MVSFHCGHPQVLHTNNHPADRNLCFLILWVTIQYFTCWITQALLHSKSLRPQMSAMVYFDHSFSGLILWVRSTLYLFPFVFGDMKWGILCSSLEGYSGGLLEFSEPTVFSIAIRSFGRPFRVWDEEMASWHLCRLGYKRSATARTSSVRKKEFRLELQARTGRPFHFALKYGLGSGDVYSGGAT